MARSNALGELEHLVLLVVLRLDEDAYGMRVSEELTGHLGREVSVGSVYAALDRLEARGYLTGETGDPTPRRGGRAKRYFRVKRCGVEALARSQDVFRKLWDGLDLDPARYR
jgi:PadR family transcriptional regulator PadR